MTSYWEIFIGKKHRFEERKFFSCYEPQISKLAKKDDREQAINELSDTWPELSKWVTELSNDYKVMRSKAYKHPFIKHAVSGELNTYVLFTELAYSLLSETGICSLIVKSTLATAPAHKGLWSYLLREKALVALYFLRTNTRFSILIQEKDLQLLQCRRSSKHHLLFQLACWLRRICMPAQR